jgi:8-amino-7-oxononanoate synthase
MTLLNEIWNAQDKKHSSLTKNGKESHVDFRSASISAETIEGWLIDKLAELLEIEPHEIDVQKTFSDYALDSVEAINLSGELESFLGTRLSPTLLWDYQNIEALAQYLVADRGDRHRINESDLESVESLTKSSQFSEVASERTMTQDNQQIFKLQDIPVEYYQFEAFPEYQKLQERLEEVNNLGKGNPFFIPQEKIVNNTTVVDGRKLINFATYNYIGMCGDREVSKAAIEAIELYGTSAGASRLISGEKPLHRELEREIADFIGTEDSIICVGGHATNVSTIGHLFGSNDLIVYDALSHNSILQGCFLSGASLIAFPHNDWSALDRILSDRRHRYQKVLIAIEGVYSTDGDIADLPKFIEVKQRHKALLLVDEAHSIGVLGQSGRGVSEYFGINPQDVDLWMGTLSKSFASCGGYIAGCRAIVEYLKYTSPGFVFSVGMSPPNTAAALAAIRVLKAQPERVLTLQQRAKLFLELAKQKGLNTGLSQDSPVIPIVVGDSLKSIQLSQNLREKGINVPFMIYPSVPQNEARLRFFITCDHTEEQIRLTVDTLAEELKKLEID